MPEVNDKKITACKVDIVFLIDEVEDQSRDALAGLRKCGEGTRSGGILKEKVLNKIVVINGGRVWFAKRMND